MESKRRVRDRISFVLLILGNIATALSGQTLNCTNDYEEMVFCQFEAQNCTEYRLILQVNGEPEKHQCIFEQCDGQCCCSLHQIVLVTTETHTATVWKGIERVESKTIDVTSTIKPRTPTIVSVKESNGNFQVKWKTNQLRRSFADTLNATVTYHKKGHTANVSKFMKPNTVDGLNYYEIHGGHLEPSTTYAVSVKSYTRWSDKFSDSSEEWEFTTPVSQYALTIAIIISLCFAAVIISAAIYGCYVKLKTKWLDTVAKCPNPKLLLMHSSEQEFLKPALPIISSVWVEPRDPEYSKWLEESLKDVSSGSTLQSSGISTGSSCLSYANTEPTDIIARVQDALVIAFPNISPISPFTTNPLTEFNKDSGLQSSSYNPCGVRADDSHMSFGSQDFENKTYCSLHPKTSHPILKDSSEVQAEIPCDSNYLPSAGDNVPCAEQQALACLLFNLPPGASSLMPIDMSYQQHNADSLGVSHSEDSSLSSISSGTNTIASCDAVSGVKADGESFDGATKLQGEMATIWDENPFYGCVPAGSHSVPPLHDDYQPFQSLVEQNDILFTEEKSGEKEEYLNTFPG